MNPVRKILIANRGEIAIRVMRAAHQYGISCVAVYAEDDADSLHRFKADEAWPLGGRGSRAYLDINEIIAIATENGCDSIHPGYGFLSENADFAAGCETSGLKFIGPCSDQLSLFGDKAKARAYAQSCDVPLLPGTVTPVSLEEARAFMTDLPVGRSIMIKALAGGGGRGMRQVHDESQLAHEFERCRSEAKTCFGDDRVYVERFLNCARHLEVQIIGDGVGGVSHLYERECTLQRRNQKILEIAPSPSLPRVLRRKLTDAAKRMAQRIEYRSLGTFEFLVDASEGSLCEDTPFYFMEANPRIQVEHTVTEEVLDVDLVKAQFDVANGKRLDQIGFQQENIHQPLGYAVQARINMETIAVNGAIFPSLGTISSFEPPSGRGVRNEGFGYAGYTPSPSYDSLIAKLIIHSRSENYADALARLYEALCEYRISGVETNIGFLLNLLKCPEVIANDVQTSFVEQNLDRLSTQGRHEHPVRYVENIPEGGPNISSKQIVLPDGTEPILAPTQGVVVAINYRPGERVEQGDPLFVLETMKMEFEVTAPANGILSQIYVGTSDIVSVNETIAALEDVEFSVSENGREVDIDLDHIRDDLQEVIERHHIGLDASRPDAVAKRRSRQRRTARENISDLCDDGSFHEYGPLVIAAQRQRLGVDTLIKKTPADGLIAGVAIVNGDLFSNARVVVLSYDYTVAAGTQGVQGHRKMDRLLEVAEREQLPVILFAEGGGGRPGDTDAAGVSGLDCVSFHKFAKLSGKVPLIGVASGRCFAGNAALFGCCDVTIATTDVNLGMGGPAMVEGGGLGSVRSEDIGPVNIQRKNGVLDVVVRSDAEAVTAAKTYLGLFQGRLKDWESEDQRHLRHIVPENRRRAYDMRAVVSGLSDHQSVLELRKDFGPGMITALARIEGRSIGIVANNPNVMGGAIMSEEADKAARFLKLCNIFAIPILFLCDTPGIMVGPEAEETGTVRHAARLMLVGANLSVPYFTIVTRKAYGLGALAMSGGAFQSAQFSLAWPTGEMGPMGIEGGVALGFKHELEAIRDQDDRKAHFEQLVAEYYSLGKAVNVATHFEVDDVVDPANSRDWIASALSSWRYGKAERSIQPFVDSW